MRVEILAIGDELVSGHRIDTNSAWLAQQFRRLGIPVARHTTTGDQLDELAQTIEDLARRSDIVVSTGGLGPTQDDLTRFALAQTIDQPLVVDESMVQRIGDLFRQRGRTMPESNRVQAEKPPQATWIPNPHGTAPGIDLWLDLPQHRCHWFALPGVPAEMREMWQHSVVPTIQGEHPHPRAIVVEELRCFGMGESSLEAKLPRALLRGENPEIGITVSRGTITLRITASGTTHEQAQAHLQPVVAELTASLGSVVFGRGEEELQHVVVHALRTRNDSLATLEGPSAGLLSHWLSSADPAGDVFRCGEVLPQLAFSDDPNGSHDEHSPLIKQLESLRLRANTTIALGIACDSNQPDHALLAITSPDGLFRKRIGLKAHPDIVTDLAAKRALDFLRLRLALPEKGSGLF